MPVTPARSSSSATLPMTTTSAPSADVHTGRGVPQKRDRDTAQSRAPSSQFWNRFSRTLSGTQDV